LEARIVCPAFAEGDERWRAWIVNVGTICEALLQVVLNAVCGVVRYKKSEGFLVAVAVNRGETRA
jgi:hypothetical protein